MRAVPSVGRIVWTDYWAFLSLIGPVVGWGLYLAIKAPFFFWFALVATVVGVPGLFWRTAAIRGVFERGVQVEGVITSVLFFRDRGRAEFSYTYQGERYQCGNPLHKTERVKSLREGQQVTLVVDPRKPGRAFIQHLFVDAESQT